VSDLRCYLASPFRCGSYLEQEIAPRVRDVGCKVVSTWHVGHKGQVEPALTQLDRMDLCAQNYRELVEADVVVAVERELGGREFYVEIGRAIAMLMPVVYLPREPRSPFLSSGSPLVVTVANEDEAIDWLFRRNKTRVRGTA
jgi:hypothetical protein